MKPKKMKAKIDQVLAKMDVQSLEDRIAPAKGYCDKHPNAPECNVVAEYGVPTP